VRTIAVADARPMPTMPDPGMIQQGEVPV